MRLLVSFLFLASPALGSLLPGGPLSDGFMEVIQAWTLDTACWGEKNMGLFYYAVKSAADKCFQMEPTLSVDDLFPKSPDVPELAEALEEPDADAKDADVDPKNEENDLEDITRWAKNKNDFGKVMVKSKPAITMKISNLTCAMRAMELWNEDNSVNIDSYTDLFSLSESIDKDFAAEVIEAYKFCYKISQALPVEDIGKNPVTKKFGRQFFFTKCAYKHEFNLCAKMQVAKWAEYDLGPFSVNKAEELSLPPNRFDMAVMYTLLKYKNMPPEKNFIHDVVLYGKLEHM